MTQQSWNNKQKSQQNSAVKNSYPSQGQNYKSYSQPITPVYKPKMFISPEIISKIWYLCHKINTVEWSGLVFCKTEGHPINPETFSIRAIDILPMHKGEPTLGV